MENRINILFIKEDINIAIDIQQPDLQGGIGQQSRNTECFAETCRQLF